MKSNKMIITGATGYIGRNLTNYLQALGIEVYAVVRDRQKANKMLNLDGGHIIECDLQNINCLPELLHSDEYEVFYHLAWEGASGIARASYNTQLENVKSLCTAASISKRLGCKRFIATGTVTEFCVQEQLNNHYHADSLVYATAKVIAHHLLDIEAEREGIDYVWARLSNIYGGNDATGNLISYTLSEFNENKIPTYGPCRQPYNFTHIDDVVNALYLLGISDSLTKREYTITNGENEQLYKYIIELSNKYDKPVSIGAKRDDGIKYKSEWFEDECLSKDTGFIPRNFFFAPSIDIEEKNIFEFQPLELTGAYVINNFYYGDDRGGFTKLFDKIAFKTGGIDFSLNETFFSISKKNVVRGLHFQMQNPQAKLVSVISGKIWDVIVDLRPYSKTYKKWIGVELSAEDHRGLYIPRDFAHGFVALEDKTVMLYQCDGQYDRESDSGIIYNDPDIGIKWPIEQKEAILSEKDLNLQTFKEYEEKRI